MSDGTPHELNAVAMTDAQHGVAVGNGGGILLTDDGGATWTPSTNDAFYGLWAVAFADASNGVLVGQGGIVSRTSDGGVTWTNEASGTANQLSGVAFVDGAATAVGGIGTILRSDAGVADAVFSDGFDPE